MNSSEKCDEIAAALAPALARLKNPKPDTKGQVRGRTDYQYVSLAHLVQHVRDVFKDVGLAVTQDTLTVDGGIGVATRIYHLSGQWIEYGPLVFQVQGSAQDAGSAITYARRYALAAAVGVAADDDDDGASARPTSAGDAFDQATPRKTSGATPLTVGVDAETSEPAGEGPQDPIPPSSSPGEAEPEAGSSPTEPPASGEATSDDDPATPEQFERLLRLYGTKVAMLRAAEVGKQSEITQAKAEELILAKAGA